jgi:hypothetical protein
MKYYILIAMLLVGCGSERHVYKQSDVTEVDEELQYLVDDWQATMRFRGIDISRMDIPHSIKLVEDIATGTVGHCLAIGNRWEVRIKIRKSELLRKVILWHELGHCVLDQNHWTVAPDDIMYPYLPQYTKFWEAVWPDAERRYLDTNLLEKNSGLLK